jgi:phospholipase/lecithinase/hemolysin
MRQIRLKLAALGVAVLLAACGGGGDGNQATKVAITSVKVMGDSLSDSGTFSGLPGSGFGRVFSVQGPATKIWTESTAAIFGVTGLCNFYKFTGSPVTPFIQNPVAGCTSYAIGGGRIQNLAAYGGAAGPQSIPLQLATGGALAVTYKATDLLLIDGGGNDAADLTGAYLGAAGGGAGAAAYGAFLSTQLDPTLVGTTLATGAAGFASIGGAYMTKLADVFYDSIQANVLNKGATHVVILNVPAITNTPRFQMVLDGVAAASGGGVAGATARAQTDGLVKSWIVAFNTQLTKRVAGNPSVLVVDFYTNSIDQFNNPAQFGLTNVKTPACPITGVGTDGLPTYNFQTCTADALSAQTPPVGATGGADWWKTYAFSDGFHPSPLGYQLMSQLVARSLASAGWI